MRTTVDLPPAVHARATSIAHERRQSLSAVVAELTVRGLSALGESIEVTTDPVSELPTISIGAAISADDVAAALDDE